MFDLNWMEIGRIFLLGIMAYIFLIILLRVAGKRSLAQLNAFDLVITVSIGSVLATIMLDSKISIFDGIAALFVLVALQWIFSFSSRKSNTFDDVVTSDPALLFYNGNFFVKTMEKERIRKDEMIQAVRLESNLSMEEVRAVILEPNGELSILPNNENGKEDTLNKIIKD
ncbi:MULTISPECIES: YetF domain-containing protein [unclassified Psychrobacillus]|uniref:DUF421 domain-containing protein n=1 Tax=unclassified Psychrobacillus TaxID=2636677 RepID=UPI00146F615F|nr:MULTISPECIES: YetF domain-containing protein [unclassified Psychrobacillus]MCM3359931.1 DUF421 domain-containing protein [Psychrobacillus sp. MER TA 171]NME07068.1 DUF421 domain-containing protein [Psychrobacillus sp. BL-248-WT-3]